MKTVYDYVNEKISLFCTAIYLIITRLSWLLQSN